MLEWRGEGKFNVVFLAKSVEKVVEEWWFGGVFMVVEGWYYVGDKT